MGWFSGSSGKDSGGGQDDSKPARGRHAGDMSLKSARMKPAELGRHRRPGDVNGLDVDDMGFGWRVGGEK